MSQPMIEANQLTKLYRGFAAVRDVSFTIQRGEVVAFLGPNGAGKTTTMRLLTGYIMPTSGTASIAGLDVAQHRLEASRRLGYLPENGPLYLDMLPFDMLNFFGEARGLRGSRLRERIDAVTNLCDLSEVLFKPIGKLSRGFRQRVGMAQVLLHDPDVLIMDEPTSGLDPNQVNHVRQMLRQLGKTKTILLSTHILQEVEAVADRVILINQGRIVFDGTPTAFAQQDGANYEQAFHRMTGAA